ncbi:nucleoid-associated protein [Veillonella sp.]|uniref:nucleoid-associated protein n=1 Tax=Veillonella sp. TaxID=1926307 RepID=UPI0025D89B31|nr:nucleoid-associated protein [Veillonella sp.]
MELKLKNAVLNILDFTNQQVLLGDTVLNVGEDTVVDFLIPLLKKGFISNKAKSFVLLDTNPMMELIINYKRDKNLNEWANAFTRKIFTYMSHSALNTIMDFIAFEIENAKGERYLGFGICEEKAVFKPRMIENDINIELNRSLGNTLKYFVSINLLTNQVRIIETKTEYDGEVIDLIANKVFNSGSFPSDEETFKTVKKVVIKTANDYETTGIDEVAKLYKFLASNAAVGDQINIEDAINHAFQSQPSKAADAKEIMKELNMLETLPMDPSFASKKTERIKIKTDTGVEISAPQEYLLSNDFIEVTTDLDGTTNLMIKCINKITYK